MKRKEPIGLFRFLPHILPSKQFTPKKTFKEGLIDEALSNSMQRLGISAPLIYWLHSSGNFKENISAISNLKKQGKIKSIGVSNFTFAQIKESQKLLNGAGVKLDAVQNHYSLLHITEEQSNIVKWCRENNVVYFSYMVLEQGVLTGHYSAQNHFPVFSNRKFRFGKSKFVKIAPLLELTKKLGEKYGINCSQIPIMWAIAKGTVPTRTAISNLPTTYRWMVSSKR